MTQEWLNRIALAWELRYRIKYAHSLFEQYSSATEIISHHPTLLSAEAIRNAEQEATFIQQHNIKMAFFKDANYPYRLAQCIDAPIMLYSKGALNMNPKHAVSIVGTRTPSERGKEWCRKFILDLAAQLPELTIISGLAYGIDVEAHKAAIEAGIPTIIVPAHGLDRIYPSIHRNIAVQSLHNGGILTEYIHGTEPEKHHFVARNRIIAGLADAVVIVESKAKGGSLITARMAQDYSREVFTLPGRYNDRTSEGCNCLIQQQRAQLITSADDLLFFMQWENAKIINKQPTIEIPFDLNATQAILLNKLRESEDGWHVNQLVLETHLPYQEVASELMMMELSGFVKGLPGGMWRALENPNPPFDLL